MKGMEMPRWSLEAVVESKSTEVGEDAGDVAFADQGWIEAIGTRRAERVLDAIDGASDPGQAHLEPEDLGAMANVAVGHPGRHSRNLIKI